MARSIEAYKDNRGQLYYDPASAVVADIAEALGRVGDEGGLTQGVARLILMKRREIERAFADLDELLEGRPANVIDVSDHPRILPRSA